MKKLYKTFRLLLSSGTHKETLDFINKLSPMEVATLFFMAICDGSDDLQEVKNFVINYHGGLTKFHKVWNEE